MKSAKKRASTTPKNLESLGAIESLRDVVSDDFIMLHKEAKEIAENSISVKEGRAQAILSMTHKPTVTTTAVMTNINDESVIAYTQNASVKRPSLSIEIKPI